MIPVFLNTRELKHLRVRDMRVVGTKHERKPIMVREAGAFMAPPGGFGALDELFEALAWSQLAIHDRLVGIQNANGFSTGCWRRWMGWWNSGFSGRETAIGWLWKPQQTQ